MRISYIAGCVVVIIAPFILLAVGALNLNDTIFLILLLFGVWTVVQGLTFSESLERARYVVSGIIIAFTSWSFLTGVSLGVGIALILVGIIIAVILASTRRSWAKNNRPK